MSVLARRSPLVIRPEELANRIRSDPARRAEVKVYDAMQEQMGSGWTVFYSVPWLSPARPGGPGDGEVDFIVAHPAKGVLLIEVKGGRIDYDGRRMQLVSTDRHDVAHDIDPANQLRASKHALIGKLKALPALRGCWIDIGHAVAFPDVPRPQRALTLDLPPDIIIGADDLPRLRRRIEEVLAFTCPEAQQSAERGRLVVHELVRTLGQSTTLRNPLSLQTDDDERAILRLTEEQFRTLDRLARVRRAAVGECAGAGKTFLAVEKARRLAAEHFRTLLTCASPPLADFLRHVTRAIPNLDVMTFQATCDALCRDADLAPPAPSSDSAAALCIAAATGRTRRYDAIVVDEGQDFQDDWWVAIMACLADQQHGVLYVFHDNHQRIFRGSGSLPGGLVEIPLDENIRNTRSIVSVLQHHYQGDAAINPRGPAGRRVEAQTYRGGPELARLLAATLNRLVTSERIRHSDVVVLTPWPLERSALTKLRLPGALQLSPTGATPGRPDILVASVHDFKGLERRVAIVAELDEGLPDDVEEAERLCYVAFSRARTHLVLLGTPEILPALLPEA